MTDEIKLPPLQQQQLVSYDADAMYDYARLAVEQDRARREVREGREPHRAGIKLYDNGEWNDALQSRWQYDPQHTITIHWTPERVWIDSDRNRELARMLRDYHYRDAADALDGGER